MKKNQPIQADVNKVWEKEWKSIERGGAKEFFGHRLFVEGYPVYKRYIHKDAKMFLDVGGGTGRYGVKFGQDFPEAKVYVTDILESSLDVARRLIAETGVHNVLPQKEDAMSMSFSDDLFDVVFCDVVIQHLPAAENALREMRRVLKPGGVLIVSSVNGWNLPHRFYRGLLWLRGKVYRYGYEKNFTPNMLKRMIEDQDMQVIAEDGFYFAYGIYRWKEYHPIWKLVGRAVNRTTRLFDLLSSRMFSKYFGFEVFCVARKYKA